MTLNVHSKLTGEYRCVLNEGTERERSTGWMPNLVLDAGLDRIGSGSLGFFNYCSVGTGTTVPAISQTGLVTWLASVGSPSATATNLGSTTYAGQLTVAYTFAQGAVVGNIAELGVGWATGGGSLFSRSLIVDGAGSATTLTVVALDQLTVYYRLTNTPVITDLSSTVTISGTSYSYTGRLSGATNFFSSSTSFTNWAGGPLKAPPASPIGHYSYPSTSTIGALTTVPSGTATDLTGCTVSNGSYTNGNYYRDSTITLPPSIGNSAGGIGALSIAFGNSPVNEGVWQFAFATPIPKDNTKTLTLTLRYSWGR